MEFRKGFRRAPDESIAVVNPDGTYVGAGGGGPGGGLTDDELRASPVPVDQQGDVDATILNWPAVQSVSDNGGSLTVDGPLTDGQLRAAAVPVDTELPAGLIKNADGGLEVHVNNGGAGGGDASAANQLTEVARLEAIRDRLPAALDADGGLKIHAQSAISVANFPATQPVSLAAAVNVEGDTAADAVLANNPVTIGGRASNAVPAAMSADADVANAWFDRRGAQVVRERTSMGRTRVIIKFHAAAPATADTLLSVVKQSQGVDAAGATSIAVAANKILRLESIYVGVRAGAAAAAFCEVTLRSNPVGATVIGSPSVIRIPVGPTSATIGSAAGNGTALAGEGLEYTGTETLGISSTAQATTNQLSITLVGYEYDA